MHVSHSVSGPSGVRRWYIWNRTGGGMRKERLSSFLKRMREENNHNAVTMALEMAVKKGYRL